MTLVVNLRWRMVCFDPYPGQPFYRRPKKKQKIGYKYGKQKNLESSITWVKVLTRVSFWPSVNMKESKKSQPSSPNFDKGYPA